MRSQILGALNLMEDQCFHFVRWFEPLIDRWLAVTKTMALQRVRAAVELGMFYIIQKETK